MTTVTIPTKHRPDRLLQCIRSIDADCRIMIYAYDDMSLSSDIIKDDRVSFIIDNKATVIQAHNHLASLSSGNIHPSSDDVEYLPKAIQNAESVSAIHGDDCVVGLTVINMNCNDDAFVLVGKKFFDGLLAGVLFNPEYIHFYADTELGDYAKAISKFFVCRESRMINHHPSSGVPEDMTHSYMRAEKIDHDRRIYELSRSKCCMKATI